MTKSRVLVVEDRPKLLSNRVEFLTDAGFDADGALSREEAYECIRRRTYHVALVDINLTDYSGRGGDRQGLEVIQRIKGMNEGTKCIVISAEENVEVPVRSQEQGVTRYLIKRELDTPEDFIRPTTEMADTVSLRLFGNFGSLAAYLSWPLKAYDWESQAIGLLGVGAEKLYSDLDRVFSSIVPVLPPQNTQFNLRADSAEHELRGVFWSKATGGAVEVAIANNKKVSNLISNAGGVGVRRFDKGTTISCVWDLPERSRDSFVESAFDLTL